MKFNSSNGDEFSISPLRYQFPGATPDGDMLGDANWIVVRGVVRLSDGRTWSFDDPCMLAKDLPEVERWLRGVADGYVSSRGWDYFNRADRIHPVLGFLEQELALRLAERGDERCVIEVAFNAAAHPERSHDEPFYLRLDISILDVERAANEWHQERQAFPTR